MSMTESKAPTKGKTTRPAKTTKKNALTEKIEAALAKAVRKTAKLGQLVLTDLNVRKKKSSQTSIEGLAASIRSAGLLMNLVVFEMDDAESPVRPLTPRTTGCSGYATAACCSFIPVPGMSAVSAGDNGGAHGHITGGDTDGKHAADRE